MPLHVPLAVGVTALATAAILAAVNHEPPPDAGRASGRVAASVMVLLWAPVHTALGVGALAIAAKLAARPLGDLALAAARMLACVAVFHLVKHMGMHPALGWTVACVAYALSVGIAFRPRPREWLHIVAAHIALWGVLQVIVWAVQRISA